MMMADDRVAVVPATISASCSSGSLGQRDAFCREITRRGRGLGRVGGTADNR